ncbi:hypothetical protein K2224_29130 (plasmid) [Streptomyces sp. BHT-5-2]|uniref:hypothetical protein n=1 Tax=unclassified Streptomyces TaxID=2593676 RepID=UPI001C8F1CFB|nr:hypothetical protein [Streptomyces sp. BHT-5-2]QZL07336.1 hypothetical protein K2224_29130 [Streptomyces sp. BHT-5-2]
MRHEHSHPTDQSPPKRRRRRGVPAPLRVVEMRDPDGQLVHSIQGDAESASILRSFGHTARPSDQDTPG